MWCTIIGLLLTWFSRLYFFFFPFLSPVPLSFGFNSIWFKTVLLGIRLREKRLQESSLAQQISIPGWITQWKACFWGPPKRARALWRWATPQCNTSFLFVKKGFCTKNISLCLFSWKEEAPESCRHLMTPFQNEHLSVSKPPLHLKVTQNHSETGDWSDNQTSRTLKAKCAGCESEKLRYWIGF